MRNKRFEPKIALPFFLSSKGISYALHICVYEMKNLWPSVTMLLVLKRISYRLQTFCDSIENNYIHIPLRSRRLHFGELPFSGLINR